MNNSKARILVISVFTVFTVFSSLTLAFDGGTGDPGDPYQVSTPEHLISIGSDEVLLTKHYILTCDINMTGHNFIEAVIAPDTNPSQSSHQDFAFTGSLNGQGHVIKNFTINHRFETFSYGRMHYIGLFGMVNYPAEIKNLGIENAQITADIECMLIGILAGSNGDQHISGGDITNCYSSGIVKGFDVVGGLIGYNFGNVDNCYSSCTVSGMRNIGGLVGVHGNSMISNCYSVGSVNNTESAFNRVFGGLVGSSGNGTIRNSYSCVNVSSGLAYWVGGLVGFCGNTEIADCYATGSVSGYGLDGMIGGLVGFLKKSEVNNCYSIGLVQGRIDAEGIGALIGINDESTVEASFWDNETSGQTASAGGEGKTKAQMKTVATYSDAGWDLIDIWNMAENQTYPFLRTYSAADINKDKAVNFLDLNILAEQWMTGD